MACSLDYCRTGYIIIAFFGPVIYIHLRKLLRYLFLQHTGSNLLQKTNKLKALELIVWNFQLKALGLVHILQTREENSQGILVVGACHIYILMIEYG